MKIQNIPVSDSPNNDAFEAIVELYYQTQGYITSSGKWFWVWEKGKKQRGYQDIDVLAINGKEALIVSVTSNLDDKLSQTRLGEINQDQLSKLKKFFYRVEQYLKTVPEYKWICEKSIKYVVAYNHAVKKAEHTVIPELYKHEIKVVSAKEMLGKLSSHIQQDNLKVQDQMLRTIQLLGCNGDVNI
ncbi:hypothetical protein [Neptuniibacter sp. QD34_54]|uniref:hypothetical protein n=1 Tax=Neptuniibacter sp. QD34_54 TaxID=3398208 RepID=UPI0039F59D70